MPGRPKMEDEYTKNFVKIGIKNWILFGDPSLKLSQEKIKPKNCFHSFFERKVKNRKYAFVKIKFRSDRLINNHEGIYKIEPEENCDNFGFGLTGWDICNFSIPYEGNLKKVETKIISGVNEMFHDVKYPANAFYQDLGDEIMINVPNFVVLPGEGEKNVFFIIYS